MDVILFFKVNVFEIKNYQSILCENTNEIEKKLKENNRIKFLIFPEEVDNLINLQDEKIKPTVIRITKKYLGYENKKFNQILMTQQTAKKVIEQWR